MLRDGKSERFPKSSDQRFGTLSAWKKARFDRVLCLKMALKTLGAKRRDAYIESTIVGIRALFNRLTFQIDF